jgi:hypothetical protein
MKSLAMGAVMAATMGQTTTAQSNTSPKQTPRGPFIESGDGTKLFVRNWGDGTPIVFCHP